MKWLSIQDAWEKLLESERYDQKDDFTVVLQPSLQETNLLLRPVSGSLSCPILSGLYLLRLTTIFSWHFPV